jgi:probable selenium-dependent hydroxylase accessory protein YqeC
MTDPLVRALDAEAGLTCVVGAGGKKTTLYALAHRFDRAVVTATVRIPIFDAEVAEVVVAEDPVAALREADLGPATDRFPLGLVAEREREDRYKGYDPEIVGSLAEAHDAPVLVKADGARTRWLKAPNEREPRIPDVADTVVPVASARVVGHPLTEERVHRPERVAAVAGIELGAEIRSEDVAAVLASEEGGLKGVPDEATAIPVVNMVDSPELAATAREIADEVLARADGRISRVVLTRMVAEEPVIDVVE